MKSYNIDIQSPECSSNSNGRITIKDLTENQSLSFTWKNLPIDSRIENKGSIVSNLECGTYDIDIYDLESKKNINEKIIIECKDILSLDLLQIEGLHCYEDVGQMNIAWSGGQAPYTLSIGSENHTTYNNVFSYNILANHTYSLTIKDANGCLISRNNITKNIDLLNVDIYWEPINHYGGSSANVKCEISGGKPPYQIAWFIDGQDKPIIVNKSKITNTLDSNHYFITVEDSNKCKTIKKFFISEPSNIMVNLKTSADYHSNSYFPEEDAQKIYNLLLLPVKKDKIKDFHRKLKSNKLVLNHKNQKITQNIVLDFDIVTINNIEYMYFYISPGLLAIQQATSKLSIGDEEITLHHNPEFNNQNKLLMGSIILDQNYEYLFHENDVVNLSNGDNDKILKTKIKYAYTMSGLYLSPNISTIINFLPNNSDQVLDLLNQNNDLKIQCLTTKSNNKLGEISLYVSGGHTDSLQVELVDSRHNASYHHVKNHYVNINNLPYGDYKIKVFDKFNTAQEYNRSIIDGTYYDLTIMKSFQEEQAHSQSEMSNKYNIPHSLLNKYNSTPSKLLFTSPEFENGVLINISPSEACFEIVDTDGSEINSCGYSVMDLDYGKYTITAFHDGYKTQTKDFFINSPKDLVTVLLEKEDHGFS